MNAEQAQGVPDIKASVALVSTGAGGSFAQAQADADALASNWASLRTERDALLASSDWTQASDSPLTDEVKATWVTYRQELRDLPESADPADPTWPTPPE